MGGGGYDVAVRERVVRLSGGDQSRDVRHIRHQVGTNFVRDLIQEKKKERKTMGMMGVVACVSECMCNVRIERTCSVRNDKQLLCVSVCLTCLCV